MPVSDPFGLDEDVVDPSDRIAADQRRAEYMATLGLDGDDQAAARAIGLEKITGVPASVISLDQDRFEAQHKASVTRAILHNNQWLADYANSHSMNATVSKDDWSRLDAVSDAFQKLGASPVVQTMAKQFQAQREGFRKGFGDTPMSDWVDRWEKYTQDNQVKYPNIWNFITYNLAEAGAVWELAGRTTSGVMGAVHSSIESGLQQFGVPEDKAKSLAREFLGYVEFEMSGQRPTTTVGRTPGEIKATKDARAEPAAREADAARPPVEVPPELIEANNAAMIAKPFLENGKLPPYGADPTINRILEFGLKHDLDLLDDVMEKSHKTDTIQVPEAWNSFQNVHEMLADRKVGIDLDAINKLYGDKPPEPGDGILGDVPDITQKIESARAGGSSTIDIPVRDLTHVQPEVYKELHDFIRTWDTGPTIKEIETSKTEGMVEGFHGTRHEFEAFDTGHIGSGQGAQSYGYGHYIAQNRGVAESYKTTGARPPTEAHALVQTEYDAAKGDMERVLGRLQGLHEQTQANLANSKIRIVKEYDVDKFHNTDVYVGDRAVFLTTNKETGETSMLGHGQAGQEQKFPSFKAAMKELEKKEYLNSRVRLAKKALGLVESGEWKPPPKGNLLKVQINREPEEFLDHDLTFEKQNPNTRAALEAIKQSPEYKEGVKSQIPAKPQSWKGRSGEFIYRDLSAVLGSDEKASKALSEAGIAGVKYLDQFSRNRTPETKAQLEENIRIAESNLRLGREQATKADPNTEMGKAIIDAVPHWEKDLADRQEQLKNFKEPTSNFVVFNDKDLSIAGREPGEIPFYKTLQQTSGLVVRPVSTQEFKPVIPFDKAIRGADVPNVGGRGTVKSLYTFKYRDLIDQLDYNQLSPEGKVISDFFGKYLRDTVGDVDVHVVGLHDIANHLWPERPETPGYHRYDRAGKFKQHIVLREDTVNGVLPTWYSQYLILHEGVHGLTSMSIDRSPALQLRIESVMAEADEWMRRMDPQSRKLFNYAFSNAHEFMAEALAKDSLRQKLREVPISNTLASLLKMDERKGSMWDAVRNILKDAWQRITKQAPTNSVLDAVLHIGNMVDELRADHADLAKLDKMAPQGAEPIDPKAMGVGKKEQAAILEKIKAEEEANQAYLQKVIERDERRRQTAQWKEDEARVRDEVTKQLQIRPDIAADQLTREGLLKGQKVGRIRLDEAKLTPEQKAMLSPEHYGSRGIDPGQLASHFGYYTDDAMINQLAKLEAQRQNEGLTPAAQFNRMRDIEVERRMKEQYGFLDDNIEREVKEHLLNPTVMDRLHDTFLRTGLRAGLKEGEIITKAKLQADAKKWMGEQVVGTISSDKLLAEIGRINARIRREGNIGSATEQYKQMQNLQMHMYYAKEAVKYEREQAQQDRLFKQTGKRIISDAPEEWTNWIHTLMLKGGDDLVKRNPADLAERISKFRYSNFLEFAAEQEERGYPINMSENMFTDWKKPAAKMTLDEWRDWNDAIKTLYGYAKDANNFEVGTQKRLWQNHREFLIEQAKRERFTKDIPYNPNKTGFQLLSDWSNRLFHGLIWNESIYNRVDHGNPHGLWKRSFSYYASSSVNRWEKWAKDYAKDLERETKPFDVKLRKDVEPILMHPFRGDPIKLNRENARQMVGYMGTVTGEDKLIRGYMFPWKMDADGKITPPEISKEDYAAAQQKLRTWFERNTTKEDWNFWEKVFKLNEGAWNKYEDMVTKQGAVPAQRVALNPIDIHGKTYEGGYTPLSYDREIAQTSKKISGMAVDPEDAIGNGGIFRVTTPRSHEKARTGYAGPLYLKMDRNAGMMSNVLRDAAIRPFVINSMKAYTDVIFQNAVKEYLGNHVHAMLVPQIKSIAGMGPGLSQTAAIAERTLEYFSQNTVARLVGGNINTLGKHTLSAAINSITMVGLRPLVREAAGQWNRGDLHPTMTNREFIQDALLGLQRRKQVVLESMGGQWAERTGKRDKWRDLMAEWGSKAIGQFDLESAIPTAIAEFKRSKIQQIADTGNWDFSLARDAAERMVRAAHGDTAVSTRPEFMRAGAMAKTLARLYTFFNANLQRNYEALWRAKSAAKSWSAGDIESAKKDAAIATKMWISANLYIALVEEMISPLPSPKDEDWGTWAGKTMLYAGSGMVPIVREAVHAWLAGYPTTLGILDTGLKPLGEGIKLLTSGHAFDDEHGGKTLKALNSVYGTLKGHTNDEIGNLLKYGWDVTHQSKESPQELDEHFREIFHGRAHEPKPHR